MRRILATAALLLFGITSARAGGFSLYEASIRANGVLGAFSAFADHVSTIYYNPAGISELDGLRISGGATMIAPRSSFRGPIPWSKKKTEMIDQEFIVPNFYASYQVADDLSLGFGTYSPFGLGTKWPSDWVGRSEAIETEVQTIFVQPTIAYTLPDFGIGRIQLGGGLAIPVYGSVTLTRAVRDFVPEDVFELQGDLDDYTIGYNLGLLYTPVDAVTLGFAYRSRVETTFKGDANFNNLPSSGFPPGIKGGTTLVLPPNWTLGLNVDATDQLTFEVDYVWWGWSTYDELVIDFSDTVPALVSEEFPQGRGLASKRGYKDTYQLRGGVEYKNFGVDGLVVRGGIAYDKTPLPEKHMDPTLPDSDRLLFSAGLSYYVTPNITVDASYIFIRANQRKDEESVNGLHGVYNTYANLPGIGITMKF